MSNLHYRMRRINFRIGLLALLLQSVQVAEGQVRYSQQDVDTLSYNLGMTNAKGLKDYLETEMGMNMNHLDSFVNGLRDKDNDAAEKDDDAYNMGAVVLRSILGTTLPAINHELFGDSLANRIAPGIFIDGFIKGITATDEAYERADNVFNEKAKLIKTEEMLQIYGDNKVAGERFLEENRRREGVHELPSGVQYRVIRDGSGPKPAPSDSVRVNYVGWTLDGTKRGSTYGKEPMVVRCSDTIRGFGEALTHMPVGAVWEVYIPQDKAYAEREVEGIKPFSALTFQVELISIE